MLIFSYAIALFRVVYMYVCIWKKQFAFETFLRDIFCDGPFPRDENSSVDDKQNCAKQYGFLNRYLFFKISSKIFSWVISVLCYAIWNLCTDILSRLLPKNFNFPAESINTYWVQTQTIKLLLFGFCIILMSTVESSNSNYKVRLPSFVFITPEWYNTIASYWTYIF